MLDTTSSRQQPEARAVASNGEQKKKGPVNPVDFFELNAKAIWLSSVTNDEKALRFSSLSDSIAAYLKKVDAGLSASLKSCDEWGKMSTTRARRYLGELAEDVRRMAILCRQKGADTSHPEIKA